MVATMNVSVQRIADIERLHRGIVVVERVGPHPGRVERVGAVAVGGGGAGRYRLPGFVRVVDVGGVEIAGVRGRTGMALLTPPASTTLPLASPVITAASFGPLIDGGKGSGGKGSGGKGSGGKGSGVGASGKNGKFGDRPFDGRVQRRSSQSSCKSDCSATFKIRTARLISVVESRPKVERLGEDRKLLNEKAPV